MPGHDRSARLYPLEVHHLLVVGTGVPWNRPRFGWFRPISHFAITPNPVVAIVRRPWKWHVRHWVVVQGGWIHDPEFRRGCSVEEYPRRDWRTIRVLRPESALRLFFVQHFRS
jgi:hypothetical protein